jgi:hypothetical protein
MVRVLMGLIFLSIGCSQTEKEIDTSQWSEEDKRIFFDDNIAYALYNGRHQGKESLENADFFLATMFDTTNMAQHDNILLYAMEERFIDTTRLDGHGNWLRITVDPTFRIPYCLILDQQGKRSRLNAKMTDGSGGYFSGLLHVETLQHYSEEFGDSIFSELRALRFSSLPTHENRNGFDGETWTIEAILDGKYHGIERWHPQSSKEQAVNDISRIGAKLIEQSGIIDFWIEHNDSSEFFEKWIQVIDESRNN